MKKLMGYLNIDHLLYTSDQREVSYQQRRLKGTLKSKYGAYWEGEQRKYSEGKRIFFTQYINKSCLQDYLISPYLPPKLRKVITRFRIGAHKLPIETGRYYSDIARIDRHCPLCCNGMGDEKHYLTSCDNPVIVQLRNSFYSKIGSTNGDFMGYSGEEKVLYLMTTSDHNSLLNFGFFLEKIESIFKERCPQV